MTKSCRIFKTNREKFLPVPWSWIGWIDWIDWRLGPMGWEPTPLSGTPSLGQGPTPRVSQPRGQPAKGWGPGPRVGSQPKGGAGTPPLGRDPTPGPGPHPLIGTPPLG